MAFHGRLMPADEFNRQLVAHVRPPEWVNPRPAGRYNLVVIGGGTAGLVAAAGAAGLGAKVALIERDHLGGDCLVTGCVPSKALISAARRAAAIRRAGEFGIRTSGWDVDFGLVMQRMRQLRASISPHDSAARFRDLGVDVYFGQGSFVDGSTIDVEGQRLTFARAVVATGARAAIPTIPGLQEAGYLTNDTLFSLTELPRHLAILGGGPIGCEMAQAFACFGTHVTLIETGPRILPRDDPGAAQVVQSAMMDDGVEFHFDTTVQRVEAQPPIRRIELHRAGQTERLDVDQILVATGRAPNIESLGLELASIDADKRSGVVVNDFLQTTNPHVYAAGDVCSSLKFTHAADFQARVVLQNALFLGRARASKLLVPWCTYTRPEVAHVGHSDLAPDNSSSRVTTFTQLWSDVDRAKLEGDELGFVRVYCRARTDKIIGATIVGSHAGELISELTLAMQHGIGLKRLAATIHPYPTQADALRRLGDQYQRTRLRPLVRKCLRWWFDRNR